MLFGNMTVSTRSSVTKSPVNSDIRTFGLNIDSSATAFSNPSWTFESGSRSGHGPQSPGLSARDTSDVDPLETSFAGNREAAEAHADDTAITAHRQDTGRQCSDRNDATANHAGEKQTTEEEQANRRRAGLKTGPELHKNIIDFVGELYFAAAIRDNGH